MGDEKYGLGSIRNGEKLWKVDGRWVRVKTEAQIFFTAAPLIYLMKTEITASSPKRRFRCGSDLPVPGKMIYWRWKMCPDDKSLFRPARAD